jgi:hypothetical protein
LSYKDTSWGQSPHYPKFHQLATKPSYDLLGTFMIQTTTVTYSHFKIFPVSGFHIPDEKFTVNGVVIPW